MKPLKSISALISLLCSAQLYCQIEVDSALFRVMDEVVISATRTEKKSQDVAVPTIILSGKEVQLSGYTELNQILAEQSGIVITEGHGSGIQIQGFDPEYTMILIDGDPMIGRTAGVLDLDRINLRNVARIEIVKGAASCLYGSEAMGGAVNIITKSPAEELDLRAFAAMGSPSFYELGLNASGKNGALGWSLFADYQHAAGFDLNDSLNGVNLGRSRKLNLQAKGYFNLGDYDFKPALRFYRDNLPGDFYQNTSTQEPFYSKALTEEISGVLPMSKTWNKGIKTTAKLYASYFRTASSAGIVGSSENATDVSASNFKQQLIMPEFTVEIPKSGALHYLFGVGGRIENVSAERYAENRALITQYAFGQMQFRPIEDLELTGGIRADHVNLYGSRLSPKLSAIYQWKNKINLKGSLGYGFKTPDFRQLYLDFTNQAIGYSVVGSEIAADRINQLQASGVIAEVLPDLANVNALQAEISQSINLGLVYFISQDHSLEINFFHNKISNLINSV
ncbi:MAG: TonB-dependent receptor plug domain-containing protein, partial [Luteibaculum sp.]